MDSFEETVSKYAMLGSWEKVTREIEEYDTMHCAEPAAAPVYVLGLLGYMIRDDLINARALYRRLAPELQTQTDVEAAWNVGKKLWKQQGKEANAAIAAHNWDREKHGQAVDDLKAALRDRAVATLTTAYSRISVAKACDILSMPRDDVLALAQRISWPYDAATDSLHGKTTKDAQSGLTGLAAINAVADTAFFLEQ